VTQDLGRLALRLSGLLMAFGHGWGKVQSLVTGGGERLVEGVGALGFPWPLVFAWAAALAEFAGGLLVALGLATRVAAAFAGFTMAVAAFMVHHAHGHLLANLGLVPVDEKTREGWGNPEMALLYLLIFVSVALAGPGRYSIDARLAKRRGR
jgi:putative oxidoreductase